MKGPGEPFFHPFYGADGVFLGAAMLFFTYVGFDAICNAAEEVGHGGGRRGAAAAAVPLLPALCRCCWHHACFFPDSPQLSTLLLSIAQARNVAHMPMALLGTAGASMTLYMLLSLSLVLTTTVGVRVSWHGLLLACWNESDRGGSRSECLQVYLPLRCTQT